MIVLTRTVLPVLLLGSLLTGCATHSDGTAPLNQRTWPICSLIGGLVGLATALGRTLNVSLPLANIAEQILMEAMNRGWGDQSAYTVTVKLQEEAAQVALRADGVDPQTAGRYISTTPKTE